MPPTQRRIRVHLQSLPRSQGTYYRLRYSLPSKGEVIEAIGYLTAEEAEDARTLREAEVRRGVSYDSSNQETPTVRRVIGSYGDDLLRRVGEDSGYLANIVNRSAPLLRHLGAVFVDRLNDSVLTSYAHTRSGEKGGRRGNRCPKRSVILDELKLLRRAIAWYALSYPGRLPIPVVPTLKGIRTDARPKRRMAQEELHRIVTALRERGAVDEARLVEFMAWCPRRPIAVFALTRADCARVIASGDAHPDGDIWIQSDKGAVGLGWCPLLPRAREILREHLLSALGPADAPVWRRPAGGPWTNQSLRGLLVRACTRAEVEAIQPYDLRRFGVTRALRAVGGDPEAAMAFTGHTSSQTVLRYAYADRDVVRAAARGETG